MNFYETVLTALSALKTNKVRSFLTMLGIIIGVFAVLALVSLVQGVTNFVTDQFNSIGSNLILVAPGRVSVGRDPSLAFANNKLTVKDVDSINKNASDFIVAATPNIRLSKTVLYKDKSYLASVVGVNYKFMDIANFNVVQGRSFSKAEEDAGARVVIVGPQVVKNLFTGNPLNKTISIDGNNFAIIGVTEHKGFNADERVILPYTTVERVLKVKQLSGISIKVKSGYDINLAMTKLEIILLGNHKRDEFSVLSQKDILSSFQNILGTLSVGLGAIAAISLLVGGIGIMNIMLVSVNERISEIGLRKAVGATPQNIAMQFILESSFLSILGGLVGIALGLLATFAVQSFLRAEVPLWAIGISFGFSLFVGVVFGTYPAISASKLDPIEALRYEL